MGKNAKSLHRVYCIKLIFLCVFFLLVKIPFSLKATDLWNYEQIHLKNLSIDGGLFYKFTLGSLTQLPEAAFNIELVHTLSRYSWDLYPEFSLWTVPQLTTYVVSFGEDQIIWLAPNGKEYVFDRNERANYKILETIPAKLNRDWTVVHKPNTSRVEIHSNKGWVYIYRDGILKFLELPSGQKLRFKTDLTQIHEISIVVSGEKHVLLEAEYDALKRLSKLTMGANWYQFEYISDSDLLKSFKPFGIEERANEFNYYRGFVSKIMLPTGKVETIEWHLDLEDIKKRNPLLFESLEVFAVLARDSDYLYQIQYKHNGIALSASDKLNHQEYLLLNPIKNSLLRIDRNGLKHQITWKSDENPLINDKLAQVTAPNGSALIDLTYDSEGRVVRMEKRGEGAMFFKYDALDRITELKRGSYPSTKYYYKDKAMDPYKITDPLGHSVVYAFTDRGQISNYLESNGAFYHFKYNDLGQLIQRYFPLNVWISLERDVFGRIVGFKHSNGTHIKKKYDAFNQVIEVQENDTLWEYSYDLKGRVLTIHKDGKVWEHFSYALNGELISVTQTNSEQLKNTKDYDLAGNLIKETDPLGNSINFRYDAVDQLLGWEDQESGVVDFKYDSGGNLIAQRNKLNHVIQHEYNPFGLLEKKDTSEQAVAIRYDSADRITFIDYGFGQQIQYKYDAYGRIQSAKAGDTLTQYAYNAKDWLTMKRITYASKNQSIFEYEYNSSGYKTRTKLKQIAPYTNAAKASVTRIRNEYDLLNRLVEVYENDLLVQRNYYDPHKLVLREKTLGHRNREQFDYVDRKVVKKTHLSMEGDILYEEHYIWDERGDLVANYREYAN